MKNVIDEDNIIRLMDKIKLYEKELKNNYNRIEQELTNIDNYIYEIKIPKENKVLVNYLKDYL